MRLLIYKGFAEYLSIPPSLPLAMCLCLFCPFWWSLRLFPLESGWLESCLRHRRQGNNVRHSKIKYTSRGPDQELSPSRNVAVKWGSSRDFLFSPFLYFWQHWDLVAVRGLSLVVVRRATLCCSLWASPCGGFCYGAQALGTSGLW